jgi:hypothetical protein
MTFIFTCSRNKEPIRIPKILLPLKDLLLGSANAAGFAALRSPAMIAQIMLRPDLPISLLAR